MTFRLLPRALFMLGTAVPVVLIVVAVALSIVGHVAACPLCIVQRMLYIAIALASLSGWAYATDCRAVQIASSLMIAILAAAGAAVAGYQIYLQYHPFAATCGNGASWWERMVDAAGQALPILFKADGLCSDSTWSLLGLSIAEWSLLAFCGLFAVGVLAVFPRPIRQ